MEVSFNKDAGRGALLIVKLAFHGEELPCIVDTGSSSSCFDKSLEPKLGKQLGTANIKQWGKLSEKNAYAMPKLYLGGVRLQTGDRILTSDLKQLPFFSDRPIMAMLGMDVLGHYCVQLDFTANKLRFLDDQPTDKSNWGRMFPIVPVNAQDMRPAVAGNLLGMKGPHSLIDSGFETEGWLIPEFFRQYTNIAIAPADGEARLPDARFFGENYSDVTLYEKDVETDAIGLSFLARHLVTLDFPNHALYLKRTSNGPLPNVGVVAAINYLKNLKDQGQLPGWTKEDHGTPRKVTFNPAEKTVTVDTIKDGDATTYHYVVRRAFDGNPWKLQKSWRTDRNGNIIEEYPAP